MNARKLLPSPAMVVATVALFVALGGSAYAVRNNSVNSKDIKNGSVRGKDVANSALRGVHIRETTLEFVCPKGTTVKAVGECFEASASLAPTQWKDAVDACAAKGGTLPTPSELRSATGALGNVGNAGDAEWTDSGYEENGNRKAIVADGNGGIRYRQQDQLFRYRCVMPLL